MRQSKESIIAFCSFLVSRFPDNQFYEKPHGSNFKEATIIRPIDGDSIYKKVQDQSV